MKTIQVYNSNFKTPATIAVEVNDVALNAGDVVEIMQEVQCLGDEVYGEGHLARFDVVYKQTARRESREVWAKWVKVGTATVTGAKTIRWYDDNYGSMRFATAIKAKFTRTLAVNAICSRVESLPDIENVEMLAL